MHRIRLSNLSQCLVFFDFDATITPFDVLDDIVARFSINNNWKKFERDWRNGLIGSQKCLEGQLESVRVTKKELFQYLSRIKIDPHFGHLVNILAREGIKPVILSDSFKLIIKGILSHNSIDGVKIFANNLRFDNDRLRPSFPYKNRLCLRCAHCKKKNLLKREVRDKIIMYIGDGLSDVCPAENSDIVFAKGSLLKHFRKKKRLCIAFSNLEDIYDYFRGLEK